MVFTDDAEAAEREHPHGEIVEVLPVTVGRLADADPDRPAEDAVDLSNHPFCLVQVPIVPRGMVKGDEQDHPERVRP
jgi:hypothetical protein